MSAVVASASLGGDATEGSMTPSKTSQSLPESRKNALFFFGTQGAHGFLSNFSFHAFQINNVIWRTVEHYYQVRKAHWSLPSD
jgi:predicted NAD-dependent protein-ADP-ribosyltransferase YbiA (DUF1768 family)